MNINSMTSSPGIDFNAQHSPMGAFMSFTCGHFGAGGGIGLEIGRPAEQSIYVGVKNGDRRSSAPVVCLPFVRTNANAGSSASDYQVAAGNVPSDSSPRDVRFYAPEQITREYGWATDTWKTLDLCFTIFTPFGPIPEPGIDNVDALRSALLPAVAASLQLDNRAGTTTKTLVFALGYPRQGIRQIDYRVGKTGAKLAGFAYRRNSGFLTRVAVDGPAKHANSVTITAFQRWSVNEGLLAENDPVHALGTCGGIAVEVPPGVTCTLEIAIGVYLDGIVTTGLEGKYLYTRYFAGLEDVLASALSRFDSIRQRCVGLDEELRSSSLSADQQFLVAHSTRSYYGSTQLLDVGGEPFWIVNEGEYCMMNTLDLSVDQAFWELKQNPWVVRNILDNFLRRYAYVDQLQAPGGQLIAGGITFTHDMGVNNNFSPPGASSYEQSKLNGCFSYMSAEQLCNWILLATCYVAQARDLEWLKRVAPTIGGCLDSLVARSGDSGMIQFDSSRCQGGQEITTYDSLDPSLAQTRNNVYMAVKCWASLIGLSLLSEQLDDSALSSLALERAEMVAMAVVEQVGSDAVIPAVFEKDNTGYQSRILPAAEGLIYPLFWKQVRFEEVKLAETLSARSSRKLLSALAQHTRALLLDPQRRNFFVDGGIRLSSTSDNSWASKIAIFQHISRRMLNLDADPTIRDLFAKADAAHVRWQIEGSRFWACSDQFVLGKAMGSRYYPRIITSAIWMDEPSAERKFAAKATAG